MSLNPDAMHAMVNALLKKQQQRRQNKNNKPGQKRPTLPSSRRRPLMSNIHQQRTVGDATTVGATSTCESTNQTSNQSNQRERERRETYRGHRHTANVGNVSNHHGQFGEETSERVQQGGRSDSMDSPSPEVDRRGKVRSHFFVRVGTHAHRPQLCEISVPRWW